MLVSPMGIFKGSYLTSRWRKREHTTQSIHLLILQLKPLIYRNVALRPHVTENTSLDLPLTS